MSRRTFHIGLTALAAGVGACWAPAAIGQANRVADIAAYQGADREQRLIEGAKREKELTLYTSIPIDDISVLAAAFDKKYSVKIKVWRADSEGFLQRILNEARARRFDVDAIAGSSSALEPLYRENLLQDVKSPFVADLIPEAIPKHNQWAPIYLNVFVQAYNTGIVKKTDLPHGFRDLLRPEWRGKLGIEAEDFDWFAQVVMDMGEAQGLRLFRDIVATNGISVRKGHTLLNNLVATGEVPFALTVYISAAEQAKRKGAPVDWLVLPPAIARPNGVAVARNAPHPYAAVLFYDFMIGEAQSILASRNFVTASRKQEGPLNHMPMKLIDAGLMLDQSRKWQDLFQRTFITPSR